MTILSFLLVIGPLIFIHELGHYFVGRWFGVKAEIFSIGFGREIGGWTDRRGTRWKVGWMPLGGYVKFKGDMNPASAPTDEWLSLPPEERAETFQAKPVWQRFLIVAAGPVTNFLFAILAFMIIFAAIGYPTTPAVVHGVVEAGPADRAGFQPGDRVVEANGRGIDIFADLQSYVRLRPDTPIRFTVERGGETIPIKVVTDATVVQDNFGNEARMGSLGVTSGPPAFETLPPLQLFGAAVSQTVETVRAMIVTLGQVITGQRSMKEMGGPLKIAQYSGQQASLGWIAFVWFMTVISINLGFINLLPIPLLDGGHLLFYTIEGVRRKPLKPEAQEWAFRTGLAALLALMIFVTLNDLASFGVWTKLGGLIG
ncbi:RIP metalloprotease RseP [Sphingosinicella humi]|uniref:Zinc metalloprotease n=1 Tax=Allosphingosinicella humi TaxID=2068657 RepID=A0A2U2IYR7_9SPHN|nr:RIP metalloprotease RseP [Sphingosinicella humi]PWG01207.1 RIP metalloprotease RseP [Sphingosinicella humi]